VLHTALVRHSLISLPECQPQFYGRSIFLLSTVRLGGGPAICDEIMQQLNLTQTDTLIIDCISILLQSSF
jgi:hypothetical protein